MSYTESRNSKPRWLRFVDLYSSGPLSVCHGRRLKEERMVSGFRARSGRNVPSQHRSYLARTFTPKLDQLRRYRVCLNRDDEAVDLSVRLDVDSDRRELTPWCFGTSTVSDRDGK
jgi:hypothetical protein